VAAIEARAEQPGAVFSVEAGDFQPDGVIVRPGQMQVAFFRRANANTVAREHFRVTLRAGDDIYHEALCHIPTCSLD
jgi:hypothetical protein